MTAPVVAPSAIQNSKKAEPIVPPTNVSPNNLQSPDTNPTDFTEKINGDILPVSNKRNATQIIEQGILETDQIIKPKK